MTKPSAATDFNIEKSEFIVRRVCSDKLTETENDALAVEEPLEIRLGFAENGKVRHQAVSITMRTPGSDFELAAGFLYTEGILKSNNQIAAIRHCGKLLQPKNTVRVDLQPETTVNIKKLERNFYTTSSCGICGKTSLEALETGGSAIAGNDVPRISAKTIHLLPEKLRRLQKVFDKTGGLHAAALFNAAGDLIDLREDVGRHNAVDKIIGAQFLAGNVPLSDKILFLSGRAGFELLQKAVMARIPVVAAVGAPSSLAVEAAKKFNVTLLGFVRDGRFNIYSGDERIIYETQNA